MFSKILIANRGEIALRILRACKQLGIPSVAVHSTADASAMHVRLADESVCIGPPQPRESYLNMPALVAACEVSGADAVHPGYGFLSENARFASMIAEHGIKFIGPAPETIATMGDKIAAKRSASQLGLQVVPGSLEPLTSIGEAKVIAGKTGYPLLVKAAAGGGGRGMKAVLTPDAFEEAFHTAAREAEAAFGNDALYVERLFINPRHIEVQVIGDGKGEAIHLYERDCSLQRRHQKLFEEAPAPGISDQMRARLGETCAKAAAAMKYEGVGTFEFLFDGKDFFFIEMNTRLQVEHAITEAITGIDIVCEQIRIAAGQGMSFRQSDVSVTGHAIECRINAEHPETFRPSPGRLTTYHVPGGPGIRVDSAAFGGYTVPPFYDSMIGKLIVYGDHREDVLSRLRFALDEFVVDGTDTNLALHRRLVNEPDLIEAKYHVQWLETLLGSA